MAKSAVVNPRRRRRAARSHKRSKRRRRSNPGTSNPRRRTRRRRNAATQSVYSRGGYRRTPNRSGRRRSSGRRRKNPEGYFDVDRLTEVVPAATMGVQAARFALKLAGPFESIEGGTTPAGPGGGLGATGPGIKHAIALVVAAQMGGNAVGSILGSDAKGQYASIAALGFAGDLFLHKRFMRDSEFASKNLYLGGFENTSALGDGDWEPDENLQGLAGFENQSALGEGETYVQDEFGRVFIVPQESIQGSNGYAQRGGGYSIGGSSFGYSRG